MNKQFDNNIPSWYPAAMHWVRRKRVLLELSQHALAHAVGMSQPVVSRIEAGVRAVTADERIALLRALNAKTRNQS